MNLLLLLVSIGVVFLLTLVASIVMTRLSGAGRLVQGKVEDISSGMLGPGPLIELSAELELVEFEGLGTPSALLLSQGDDSIQVTLSEGALEGVGPTSLLPTGPSTMTGSRRSLGAFRVIGQVEEFPIRHLRIRALKRL